MTTTSLAYCIVPKCPSTKKRNPEKLFFSVPSGKVRNKWSAVVRRTKISLKGSYYCCEDHFDPETDVDSGEMKSVDLKNFTIVKSEHSLWFV
ncbi:hypothetical protein M8J77_013081 [Diaphorina citri]|nr:hypothetical protein M8J77_013081 [Diaphorina citri]